MTEKETAKYKLSMAKDMNSRKNSVVDGLKTFEFIFFSWN